MVKDCWTLGGLIFVLSAVLSYFYVGAANPLYQASHTTQVWVAGVFGIPALLCFYFAWRTHVKDRQANQDELILYPDEPDCSDDCAFPAPANNDINVWLDRWKAHEKIDP